MINNRFRMMLGWSLILVGVAVNRFVIEAVVVPDGTIGSPVARAVILAFQITAVAGGVLALTGTRLRLPSWATRPWVLVVVSIVVSIFGVEVALRLPGLARPWIAPRTFVGDLQNHPSEHFISDSLIGWRMRPHTRFRWLIEDRWSTYVANDGGYRTPYTAPTGPAVESTVVLIGDSFAFGTGVDHRFTFAAILDSLLPSTRVYNMAMPGFGVDQMWMSLRHYAIPLNPQAVIVAFIDNDLDRSLYAYRAGEDMNKPIFVLAGDSLRPQLPGDRAPHLVTWLEGHSAAWNLGRHAMRTIGYRQPVGAWWKTNEAIFTHMWQDAVAYDVPVLFVRLPLQTGVAFPQLGALMDRLDAPFIDLQEAMGVRTLHFAIDGHMDELGHRFVADRIAPILRQIP